MMSRKEAYMRERVLELALAGLLHDVGKFAQRAGWRRGKHADVGGEFVDQYVPSQWKGFLYPVMGHHDSPLQGYETKVIALADRLSAGERSDTAERQPRRLLSVFCQVQADGQACPSPQYVPLRALAIEETTLFSGDESEDPDRAYGDLWDGFARDIEALARVQDGGDADLETYVDSLLMLLQRHAWCIPSAYYRSLPDVSLYDHSRMTAALAACLAGQEEAVIDAMLQGEANDEPVALLVGGDISGVQDFIYTLSSRGATSALRGRSFYLQLLTEAVFRYVLRRLELPSTNLVYGGGGHFYLLAPPQAASRLPEIQRYVSRVLLRHHGGDLYLALGKALLRAGDFKGEALSGKWRAVSRELRQAKERRFSELGDEMYHQVFEPWRDQGNQERECLICHREHPGTQEIQETRKCPPCLAFEELGEDLRQARVLRLDEVPVPDAEATEDTEAGTWEEVLAGFGLAARVTQTDQAAPVTVRSTVLALEDNALSALSPGPTVATGRRFLVNVTPEQGGRTKTFEQMAVDAQGIERLGVLRMDVDDLGRLFSRGLGEKATLSRTAALSFAVSLFFEGWVEALAERHNPSGDPPTDRVYSIYSGGDDLFMVGSWDALPDLAQEIRDDFSRFVSGHPGLHLSGGIALIGGKYPLYQAAEDAGEAERQAKGYPGKNAITFLGQTLNWETFCRAAEWKGKMWHMCHEKRVPRSLLRTLVVLQQQHDEEAEKRAGDGNDRNMAGEPQTYYGPWIPRAAYVLSRMQGRHGRARDELQELKELLGTEHFAAISWIGLAARWAELSLRKGE
jgi:CRISPR-associated protein Csm1